MVSSTLIVLTSCVVLTTSLTLDSSFNRLALLPSKVLRDARGICLENTTNAESYEVILTNASTCYAVMSLKNESLCYNLQRNVQKCSQPLVDFFVNCLPEKSKEIPPAIVTSVSSLVRNFCASTGDLLLEDLNPCITAYENNTSTKEQCRVQTITTKFEAFRTQLPSKSELCQVVREGLDCWKESVDHDCESQKAKEFFSSFYDSVLSGCN